MRSDCPQKALAALNEDAQVCDFIVHVT